MIAKSGNMASDELEWKVKDKMAGTAGPGNSHGFHCQSYYGKTVTGMHILFAILLFAVGKGQV